MIISYNKIINKRMNAKMLQLLKINLLRDTWNQSNEVYK